MFGRPFYTIKQELSPIIAVALHDGHELEPELRPQMRLDEQGRAREEDPYTGYLIADLPVTTVVVHRSRFQIDLNRSLKKSIYETPNDAWGLHVWSYPVDEKIKSKLFQDYKTFYRMMANQLAQIIDRYGYFILLDVHSYNYKRNSPQEQAKVTKHPEINLGTWYNQAKWSAFCDDYESFLKEQIVQGKHPDVQQNVVFKGGHFAQWIIEKFGTNGIVFSIEFKKTFMDEWTGVADVPHLEDLKVLLSNSIPFLTDVLLRMKKG